jgi:nicotinamidase-related amidase
MSTALLVIDVQQALVDWLAIERRTAFLALLNPLIARARGADIPVVYVRHHDAELVATTPGWQIASEIAPHAGEHIVDKQHRDAFRDTNLADVLAALQADHLIICGMQTEYCVDATLREAERRGYAVTLIADGHATYPAGDLSEAQIIAHVNRVADGLIRDIVPAAELSW